jgi:uncharacterized protein YbjQ (UPF0145 family)
VRIDRFNRSPVHTSLLSVPAAVSLDAAGFDIIGDTMGSAVLRSSWYAVGGCGWTIGGGPAKVYGTNSRWNGFGPYVGRVMDGYRRALSRLSTEAVAMGADGVVDIRISDHHVAEGCREYSVIGTAVRARSRVHATRPFTTVLSGSEVAKLVVSGWVPMSLELAMEVAIRHDDEFTQSQDRRSMINRDNVEIAGYTKLATYTRQSVRQKLMAKIASAGADGVVVSKLTFSLRDRDQGAGHHDHIAESMIVGTSIGSFVSRYFTAPPAPLPILPLSKASTS